MTTLHHSYYGILLLKLGCHFNLISFLLEMLLKFLVMSDTAQDYLKALLVFEFQLCWLDHVKSCDMKIASQRADIN